MVFIAYYRNIIVSLVIFNLDNCLNLLLPFKIENFSSPHLISFHFSRRISSPAKQKSPGSSPGLFKN